MIHTARDWPAAPTAPPLPPPSPASPPPGRRPRRVLVAAAAVVILVVGGALGLGIGLLTRGSPAPTGSASASPGASSSAAATARALYRQALAAGNASGGFHYVALSRGGSASQKIVGDAGRADGTQTITMGSTYGTEQFTLVLVGGTVYFQGNGPALQDQLGVPAATAPTLQGKWISVQGGDGPYSVVAPGITVSDQMGETVLVPTSTQAISGARTRIVGTVATQGGATATGHLDVANGSHLPMSYATSDTSSGTTSTVTFSNWGKAPSPAAPAGAVAWSTLGASQPPGGYGNGGTPSSQTPAA